MTTPEPELLKRPPTDALLFLDETGSPNYYTSEELADLNAIVDAGGKPPFPIIFGLAGVLFTRDDYFNRFDPQFRDLKVRHLGVDVPLHEWDLRARKKSPFTQLRDPVRWAAFRDDLAQLFGRHFFKIVVVAIHKPDMQATYQPPAFPFHPYYYSFEYILERTAMQSRFFGRTWRVIAEDRATGLNAELGKEMLRLQNDGCGRGIAAPRSNVTAAEVRRKFDPRIAFRKKSQNDSGLQVADLAVGPLIRHLYRMDLREARTLTDIPKGKLCAAQDGTVRGWGVRCFPEFPAGSPL